MQHAVERTGYADFWELYRRGVLPQETRNYVPIIVAVTIMAKNPEQYGLERVTPDPAPQVDQVTIDYPVDLRLVAECVDTSVNYLQELNPSLLRMTTPEGRALYAESSGRLDATSTRPPSPPSRRTCGPMALSPGGIRRHAGLDRAQVSHLAVVDRRGQQSSDG